MLTPDHATPRVPRRLRLVDRAFQLRYVGAALAVCLALSLGLGAVAVQQARTSSRMLGLEHGADGVFQAELDRADARFVAILAAAQLVVLAGVGALVLVVTQRMAGPLYVFRGWLRDLGEGHIPRGRGLRRGDEFAPLAEEFRSALDQLATRAAAELAALERARAALDGVETDAARSARVDLDEVITRKRRMLAPRERGLDAARQDE